MKSDVLVGTRTCDVTMSLHACKNTTCSAYYQLQSGMVHGGAAWCCIVSPTHPLQRLPSYAGIMFYVSDVMVYVATELHLNCLYSQSTGNKVVHGTMLTQQVAVAVGRVQSIFAAYFCAC